MEIWGMAKDTAPAKKSAAAGMAADKQKKQNPVVKKARNKYAKKLRADGVSSEKMPEKIKAYMQGSVKPALDAARAAAKEKALKGPERQKFIEQSVGQKLNWGS
jgi:hypothetical protein